LVHCILQFEYLQHLVSLTCGGHVWRINFRCKVGPIVNILRGPMRMQNQCRADRPSKPDRNHPCDPMVQRRHTCLPVEFLLEGYCSVPVLYLC
jgi:hypothetical protein